MKKVKPLLRTASQNNIDITRKRTILIVIVSVITIAVIVIAIVLIITKIDKDRTSQSPTTTSTISATTEATTQPVNALAEPVTDFKKRVTKKPFGIYITPETSPVQPERFSGYHTGADAEYEDVTSDVPVFAIADGKVVLSKTASGYGGVFMISFNLDGTAHTALYGHIRPSSLPEVGKEFKKGDGLGLLGTGYSSETDGERRHLHFAVLSDDRLDIKGYVQNESQLSGWLDSLTLYK